jgi:hypothetical protein
VLIRQAAEATLRCSSKSVRPDSRTGFYAPDSGRPSIADGSSYLPPFTYPVFISRCCRPRAAMSESFEKRALEITPFQ